MTSVSESHLNNQEGRSPPNSTFLVCDTIIYFKSHIYQKKNDHLSMIISVKKNFTNKIEVPRNLSYSFKI